MVERQQGTLNPASTLDSKVALVDNTPFVPGYSRLDSDSNNTVSRIHSLHLDIRIDMEYDRTGILDNIGSVPREPAVEEEAAVVEQLELVVDSRFLEDLVVLGLLLDFPPRLRTLRIRDGDHGNKVLGNSLVLPGSMDQMQVGNMVLVEVVVDSRLVGLVFERSSRNSNSTTGLGIGHIRSIHMSISFF